MTRIDRKTRREEARKRRRAEKKAERVQRRMTQALDDRVSMDMPECSLPDCSAQGTHLVMEATSLALYKQTKDRTDLKLWVGCGDHHTTIAQALKWQNIDVQVATGRALLHLGELEEVSPNTLLRPDVVGDPETEDDPQ